VTYSISELDPGVADDYSLNRFFQAAPLQRWQSSLYWIAVRLWR
jgi:hypothetical protein